MAVMHLPMTNEIVALSSLATAGIATGFLTVVAGLRLPISLAIGAVIGVALYSAGVVPIGILIAVGLALVVTVWKALFASPPQHQQPLGTTTGQAPPSLGQPSSEADARQRILNVMGRMKYTVADFDVGFSRGLLRYYLGYLTALAQGHCQALGLIWGDIMNISAWQAAENLFPAYALDNPETRFAKISHDFSPYFAIGLKEGASDIAHILDPSSPKPYWRHLTGRLGNPDQSGG